mgnify:CR=1 FL=1
METNFNFTVATIYGAEFIQLNCEYNPKINV